MQESKFSFWNGWMQLRQVDQPLVKQELMEKIGIKSNFSFIARRAGKVEPKVSEAEIIYEVFAKYGVTDPWGPVKLNQVNL